MHSYSFIFYNNGNVTTNGIADYALITYFSLTQDKIQLKNTQYMLSAYSTIGTGIYLDTNINGVFNTTDELISVVKVFAGLNLNSTSFVYV